VGQTDHMKGKGRSAQRRKNNYLGGRAEQRSSGKEEEALACPRVLLPREEVTQDRRGKKKKSATGTDPRVKKRVGQPGGEKQEEGNATNGVAGASIKLVYQYTGSVIDWFEAERDWVVAGQEG